MLDILGQSSLWLTVTSLSLGCSVLTRNVRNTLFLSFTFLTTLIALWALSFSLEKVWPGIGFYRLHLFCHVGLLPSILFFIHIMVQIQDEWSRHLLRGSLLFAFLLALALACHLETYSAIQQCVYFAPVGIVFQILRLMGLDARQRSNKEHPFKLPLVGISRKRFIYLGALVLLGTSVMDHMPWMGTLIPAWGNLALIGYLFFLSQVITQQRLLNLHALLSRFLVLIVVAFTLALIYSLLVAWIENSPGLFFLNSFIASFVILMLLEPLRTLTQYCTHRLLTQEHQKLEQLLRDSQRKLTTLVDPGSLFQTILATTEQFFHPSAGGLFVLRGTGIKFRRTRFIGQEPPSREIIASHPLVRYCEDLESKGQFPILLDQIFENEMARSSSRIQKERYKQLLEGLKALGANLFIPLFDSKKMLGFVTLKVFSPPEPWENNWGLLPLVYPYFQQAAQAMRNMEIYTHQREKERLAALGEMAAGLAHEIRNPLGAIKGAAQYLDPSSERTESRFLTVIIEEVDRLNRVVTQFLDYAKSPTTDLKKIDLSELAEKAIGLLRAEIPEEIQLEFMPTSDPVWVMASPEPIYQVMINFIQNAKKALHQQPQKWIRVSVGIEHDNSEAFFSVEDSGHGIKKEYLDKIFIPFFTTSPHGTGLGLSISQKVVEAHRGRIEVLSEEGRFTKISMILPLAKEVTECLEK